MKSNDNSIHFDGYGQKPIPKSPPRRSQSHKKVTIVLSTPPRSIQRNTTPISSSPKRVRFSVFLVYYYSY